MRIGGYRVETCRMVDGTEVEQAPLNVPADALAETLRVEAAATAAGPVMWMTVTALPPEGWEHPLDTRRRHREEAR